MNAIVAADLHLLDAEPRIHDLRLAEALGFERPRSVRQVIRRHLEELNMHGPLATNCGESRGQEFIEYHLNEAQALLICMFARTANAAKVRAQVIAVYMAWRHGRAEPVAPAPPQIAASTAPRRLAPIEDAVRVVALDPDMQALGATLAPYWSSGRRPAFWSDFEVRRLIVQLHRQVMIKECLAMCRERFGPERTPSHSAVHRFWQILDMATRART